MAYRADISSQPLTPSAPDISGAVGAIKSQAAIASTIFGGLEKGYELRKNQMLQSAMEAGEAAQQEALTKYETSLKEQQQASSDYLTAQSDMQDLAGFGITPDYAKSQGKIIPAQAQMLSAAERLKAAREAGGFRQEEYFTRVKSLVDKYAAEYPEAKNEIRRVIGEATGLPGADLWAQQQFIRRMFTPQEAKAETDKLAAQAKEDEYKLVLKYNRSYPPTTLAQIQNTNPELWGKLVQPAIEEDNLEKNKQVLATQQALQTAATDPQFLQQADLLSRSATLAAGVASAKFLNDNFERFQGLKGKLASGNFTPNDQAEAQVLFRDLKGTVQAAFARNEIEVLNSTNPNVSAAARAEMKARLKEREEATLKLLDTSSPAQTVAAMEMFSIAENKTIDKRVKLTGMWSQLVSALGDQNTIRNALGVEEFDKDGKMHPHWEQISKQAPRFIPMLREYQKVIEGSPLEFVGQSANAHPVSVILKDAAQNPEATANVPSLTPQQVAGGAQAVALYGASIVAKSRDSKLSADKAMQIGLELQRDVNIVGTSLSNLSLGHGLNIINQNKEGFKDFMAKLPSEQKPAVSFAVNESYTKSLESARRGLGVVSSDYGLKTPLQLGVRPDGIVGIKPPPKEWLQPPSAAGVGYVPLPANIRKYYKDSTKYYGGEQMVFKPEFAEEGTKWARAMEEWENKYLPRVTGAISARQIVENGDFIRTAQDVTRAFETNKPIQGFYKFPQQAVVEAPVQSEVKLEGLGDIKNPSLEKLMSLAQLPTTPEDTRKKLLLVIQDMMKGQGGR